MKRFISILALAMLVSCIKDKPTGADLKAGDMVPDFTVTMNDGSKVTGAQLREGISFIVFFHSTCPDCRKAMPEIQKIYDEYVDKGVSFALISRAETSETIAPYWAEKGYSMPYSAQEDRTIYELFARTRVPRVYINKDGIIKAIFTDDPVPGYDDLKSVLDKFY